MDTKARIGVDIGGTFTDLVLLTSEQKTFFAKVSSTPKAPEQAVLEGISAIMDDASVSPDQVSEVLHGTTVGSNTLLQKVGAKCGLITTKGFRDVLEIGRVRTPDMFDLTWDKPKPLIDRRNRLEADERTLADGAVTKPVQRRDIQAAVDHFRVEGVQSAAICFLNSYRNPANERAAIDMFRELCPEIPISASVDILPEMREYERTSTTAVNAYVLPVLKTYLARLSAGIRSLGITAPLLVSNSNGGLASVAEAQSKPVFFVSSGRSAGVVGAAHLGKAVGADDLIVFDMGGTTASASLIQAGKVNRTNEYEFRAGMSTPSRFIKAGGYMMRVPTIDVAEVGNGAGSIAWLDDGGLLHVGPVSAGADPGPACYGLGGDQPTVTDANVVLGYLPTSLAGGALTLDIQAARAAIKFHLADPLGLSIEDAAYGVREIANVNMARAIRTVTVERGKDPRDFALLAFGGSGPAHAADLAQTLNIPSILIPRAPGVFTAMGMIAGAVERYFIRPIARPLDQLDFANVQTLLDDLAAEGAASLADEGYGPDQIDAVFEMDMRFVGQDSELAVAIPNPITATNPAMLREDFLTAYMDVYGYASKDGVEAVSVRVMARGRSDETLDFNALDSAQLEDAGDGATSRPVYFSRESGWIDTPVVARAGFKHRTIGPMILESADATLVAPPGASIALDSAENISITFDPTPEATP